MKHELEFLQIHGGYGANQSWFWDPLMRIGGCAAITACELSAYLSLQRPEYRNLYPYDPGQISRMDFIRFGRHMKHFISPRPRGVYKLSFYEDGFLEYANHTGIKLSMELVSGEQSYEEAAAFLKRKIDAGIPVPYLLLKHTDKEMDDFTWHWFTMTGYEEQEDRLYAIFATYGKRHRLDLEKLWDTGHEERGGMITIRTPDLV